MSRCGCRPRWPRRATTCWRCRRCQVQLTLEAQISARVPILKGSSLVIQVGLLLAMNAVYEAETP